MKTVEQFWSELVKVSTPMGLDNRQQREIQSLVLGGIVALPELSAVAGSGVHESQMPPPPGAPTGFVWGKSSLAELKGVKRELVECSTLALTRFSKVDFRCHDGIRTIDEQRRHFKNGTTRTMKSKHLDGLAVDLVPIIGGVLKWDWDGCYEIAWAMDQAATHMGIARHVRWGGAWDRVLADYGNDRFAYKKEVQAYQNRHAGPDFIDGPHFEWVN
jgi:peptidoglycan L-alanyl-D-glutamate endopeptidase CwlK